MGLAEVTGLNYHHLRYFWVVAREGGISRASEALDVAPSTISAQISALERRLECRLFRRVGRALELTEAGRTAFRFAEEIFLLGLDLTETLRGRPEGHPVRLALGVADVVPKQIVAELLQAVYRLDEGARVVCLEGKPETLMASLAVRRFDAVILDSAPPPSARVRAHAESLGATGIALLARPEVTARYREGFPDSIQGAPLLLPTYESALRPVLDRWFESRKITPAVLGEFDDSALMKAIAERGVGIVPVSLAVSSHVESQHGLELIGVLEGASIRLYCITVERKLKNLALDTLRSSARETLSRVS